MGPHQNRVTPMGEIVAIPLRGGWLGNRGILHDDTGRVVRNHASNLWITCALSFKDWRLPQWQPHHFTVLFFHDEAVSLAAGHRPCALCRREAYDAYRNALAEHDGVVYAFCSIGCRTRFIREPVTYLQATDYSPMHD